MLLSSADMYAPTANAATVASRRSPDMSGAARRLIGTASAVMHAPMAQPADRGSPRQRTVGAPLDMIGIRARILVKCADRTGSGALDGQHLDGQYRGRLRRMP